MKSIQRTPVLASLLLAATLAHAGPAFAPLEHWKAAVAAGDKTALSSLYSTDPPAILQVGKNKAAGRDEELQFWSGLRAANIMDINPKVLEIAVVQGRVRLLLRIEAVKAGQAVVASMAQIWAEQPDGWRIVSTGRNDFSPAPVRRLPQPATPNTSLYPDPSEAQGELNAALAAAAREHKRVLVMFGANWCYDCHVLDAAFHSKDFAALVNDNYAVVHISIGEEGKDNNDLATRFGVVLDKGVPSLAVLNPDGSVLVAQKGEFESTVKIGPEDVHAFLEKWKPLAAESLDPPALPAAAKALEVPASSGGQVKFHFVAAGKQIYKCDNGIWSKASTPDATLFDGNGNAKIHHGAGPSWTMLDGTGAVKAIGSTAVHFAAPDGVSIEWLKLEVDKASHTGTFSDVGVIQRVYTGAGKAPSTGCSGDQVYESAYTAHYYFWTSK